MPTSPPSPSTPCQLLGTAFVKPGSARRWLLAAPGVLQVVLLIYFLKGFGELRGPCLGVQGCPMLAPSPPTSSLTPHLPDCFVQLCNSQSRHLLNCNGFGSLGSSISRSSRFALLQVEQLCLQIWGVTRMDTSPLPPTPHPPPPRAVALTLIPTLEGAESCPQTPAPSSASSQSSPSSSSPPSLLCTPQHSPILPEAALGSPAPAHLGGGWGCAYPAWPSAPGRAQPE